MSRKKVRLTIGLIIDFIPSSRELDMFQTRILAEVHRAAKEHDVNLICFVSGRVGSPFDWERSRTVLFDLVQKSTIDGLLVSPSINIYQDSQSIPDFLNRFNGIPLIVFNDHCADVPCVTVDNHSSMIQMVDHLIEKHGCRRIAFIKGNENNSDAMERYDAYLTSLRNHGIAFDPDLVHAGNFLFGSGGLAVQDYLEKKISFDAIVAANDNMANGAITELQKHPELISKNLPVTGFDDTANCRQYNLTSVRQSFEEIANASIKLLLKTIRKRIPPVEIEIPAKLIYRTSCGCVSPITVHALELFNHSPNTQSSALPERTLDEEITNITSALIPWSTADGLEIRGQLQTRLYKLTDDLRECISSNQTRLFLDGFEQLLAWTAARQMDLSQIQKFISALRKFSYQLIPGPNQLAHLETLLQTARIRIGEVLYQEAFVEGRQSESQVGFIYLLGEALIANLDLVNQMKVLNEYLPRLEFPQCFVVLYDEPDRPLNQARLVEAFINGRGLDLGPQGKRFQTLDVLPRSAFEELQHDRFSLVVQALHQGDHQMGFMALGIDKKVDYNLETIRYRLSVALKSSLLLKRIQDQAQDLEVQVAERTKDLSRINRQLIKEISKRTKVEGQLKKALTELKGYNQELHHRSVRDELTGLYNRRGFMDLGSMAFKQARKNGKGIFLIYSDLDDFKQINDRYGHPEGDLALKATAKILGQFFRSEDIVARFGGDEFTVLITGISEEDTIQILERLRNGFLRYNEQSHKPYRLSMSIGSASIDGSAPLSFESLMTKADQALYGEKQSKKRTLDQSDKKQA